MITYLQCDAISFFFTSVVKRRIFLDKFLFNKVNFINNSLDIILIFPVCETLFSSSYYQLERQLNEFLCFLLTILIFGLIFLLPFLPSAIVFYKLIYGAPQKTHLQRLYYLFTLKDSVSQKFHQTLSNLILKVEDILLQFL